MKKITLTKFSLIHFLFTLFACSIVSLYIIRTIHIRLFDAIDIDNWIVYVTAYAFGILSGWIILRNFLWRRLVERVLVATSDDLAVGDYAEEEDRCS